MLLLYLVFLVFFVVSKSTLYLKYYIICHTSKVQNNSQKRGISPPQNEGQAELQPPHFHYCSHTPCAWRCVSGAQVEH